MVALNSYDRETDSASFSSSTIAELYKLPTTTRNGLEELETFDKVSAGSDCIVMEDSSVWMLDGATDAWVEL